MKRFGLYLTRAAAAALPVGVLAQQSPMMSPPTQAQRDRMHADMRQMRTLHDQLRAQVLGDLTPQHRALLAQIAGNLAVAKTPDYRAAAKQLDGALSPSETSAILGAAKHMHDQMRAIMPSPPPGAPARHMDRMRHTPTAGAVLLMVAGGHDMMRMHGGHWGAPPHR